MILSAARYAGGLRGAHGERRRLVGEQDVRRERIGGRVDRDGAQAEGASPS